MLADEHVTDPLGLGLAQAEMAEVGAARIDRDVAALTAGPAERRDLVHLIDERGDVLFLGLGDRVAELDQLRVEVLDLVGLGRRLAGDPREDPLEDLELLADDLSPLR